MTKKDYIKIATILRDCKNAALENNRSLDFNELLFSFTKMLKEDNANFNTQKFIDFIYDK